jgi:hypothetical protein
MVSPAKRHAQIENMSLLGTHIRMGPVGLWVYASSFLQAAKALEPGTESPRWPAGFYLVCHALELLLKAFLSIKGRTLPELADHFQHDLQALVKEATAAGLRDLVELDPKQLGEIERASRYYSEKVFEYPALAVVSGLHPDYPKLPDFDVLVRAADGLAEVLRQPCLRAS